MIDLGIGCWPPVWFCLARPPQTKPGTHHSRWGCVHQAAPRRFVQATAHSPLPVLRAQCSGGLGAAPPSGACRDGPGPAGLNAGARNRGRQLLTFRRELDLVKAVLGHQRRRDLETPRGPVPDHVLQPPSSSGPHAIRLHLGAGRSLNTYRA